MHRRFFTYISRFACHFSRTLALTMKQNLNEIYGIRRPRVQSKIGLWLAGQNCIKMNVFLYAKPISTIHVYTRIHVEYSRFFKFCRGLRTLK